MEGLRRSAFVLAVYAKVFKKCRFLSTQPVLLPRAAFPLLLPTRGDPTACGGSNQTSTRLREGNYS